MMCFDSVSLISRTIAASVVDFPEPVGPVSSTSPCAWWANAFSVWQNPSSSMDFTFRGIWRITMPGCPIRMKMFTR